MNKLRNDITTTLQRLGDKTGNYQTPWTVTTRILKQRTNCKLYARLRHARAKGKTVSILDVLSKAEMQLYWYIVKEYARRGKFEN
jgi:hypothetical protein